MQHKGQKCLLVLKGGVLVSLSLRTSSSVQGSQNLEAKTLSFPYQGNCYFFDFSDILFWFSFPFVKTSYDFVFQMTMASIPITAEGFNCAKQDSIYLPYFIAPELYHVHCNYHRSPPLTSNGWARRWAYS